MKPARLPGLVAAAVLVLAAGAAPPARAALPLELTLSAKQISAGDTLALRIRDRSPARGQEPDLAPLDADFEVLDVQRSQRTSIVNGVRDDSVDWVIEVSPRRTGQLEIPPLSVGGLSTQAARVEVLPGGGGGGEDARPGSPGPAEPVHLNVSAERSDPYEHERVLLRVRLYAGDDLIDGALGDPELPGASVERVGKDRPFHEQAANGVRSGIERTYAVIPDAAGELVVPPLRFEGRVRDTRPTPRARPFGGSLFDDFFSGAPFGGGLFDRFFGGGVRRVVARSQPLTLHVRPRPPQAEGTWWLPARDVSLKETWKPDSGTLRVGEPLTRRVTLLAEGASLAQLPELPLPAVPGLKQYPEATRDNETEPGSVRVQEFTLIPTRAGSLELPPIELAWWDTAADAPRRAQLPGRTLEVMPAPASASPAEPGPVASTPAPAPTPPVQTPEPRPWPWQQLLLGLGVLVASAGLVAAALWWRRRAVASPRARLRGAERALRRACQRSHPAEAEAALRELALARDPGSPALEPQRWAREFGGAELAGAVAELAAVRYSPGSRGWEGAALWKAYRAASRGKRRRRERRVEELRPLYPTRPGGVGARGPGGTRM